MDHSSEVLTKLILQLSVILFAAKFAGEICERFIKIPPVIGELLSGLILGILFLNGKEILGPLFLGDKSMPGFGLLFGSIETDNGHQNATSIPVSGTLWAIGQIGAIVLLFMAGLETNLRQFVKFAGPASLVAIGGVLLPFVLGLIRIRGQFHGSKGTLYWSCDDSHFGRHNSTSVRRHKTVGHP